MAFVKVLLPLRGSAPGLSAELLPSMPFSNASVRRHYQGITSGQLLGLAGLKTLIQWMRP